ncbi:SECIS-binding protein 2 isoform X2 [Haematobia irritans]|uniref:SECIS-binding protein 2 isoform X2 n=1 Tax=Haematobia irritans TaxID=7368 RepID=UPI003F50AFF8
MSDKCKVIDHLTFEQMQQSCKADVAKPIPIIRNAKYKRMNATSSSFNILQFVRKGQAKKQKHKVTKRIIDSSKFTSKRRGGKQRENGRKSKATRLKKSILRYRQMKRNQEKLQADQSNESVEPIAQKNLVHSSRFREYCDNCTTPSLKEYTERLLRDLNRFQRRAYAQNQIKARAHRRFVIGFREVQNFLCINKVKLVIIATDCERCEGEVSLDETISKIKVVCHDNKVPLCFAFQRRQLAYFLYKKASVSCIGILDYDGARDIFQQLISALEDAREKYQRLHII